MDELLVASSTAIEQINRAEIDIQVATAKKYPRSIAKFRQEALTMAVMDEETAASCFYKLKRKNADGTVKYIEGESVRLAEICACSWGNLRYGARIIDENDRFVTAQGFFFDVEKNIGGSIEITRRICDKNGRTFSEDMIAVTKNAACSIAFRNAIFKAIPRVYIKSIYDQAKKTALGNAKTTAQRRQQMTEAFAKMSVSVEEILAYCQKPSLEDIGVTEIEDLIGVYTAIKDGDTTIDEAFRVEKKQSKPTVNLTEIKIEEPVIVPPAEPSAETSVPPAPAPTPETLATSVRDINQKLKTVSDFAKLFYSIAATKTLSVAKANDWLFATFGIPSAGDVPVTEQQKVIQALQTKEK
jgi:hypothetical protein